MGISTFPAASAASKTRYVETLTSGTSWTVPAGCTYVNATLFGGGAGGGSSAGQFGANGQRIATKVTTTPGASITYAIGAGGGSNTAGGSTTFTGATTAVGGIAYNAGGAGTTGGAGAGSQGGFSTPTANGSGAAGKIELEYWL